MMYGKKQNNKYKIILCYISCIFLLLCTMAEPQQAWAVGSDLTKEPEEIGQMTDEIINWQMTRSGAASVQDWLDKSGTENAGPSEWYVIALVNRDGNYDFTAYQDSVISILQSENGMSKVSRYKYLLALAASGAGLRTGDVSTLLGEEMQPGIMERVFLLHLWNNGLVTGMEPEDVSELLSLQLPDGGWALYGKASDVDVTAMALQALAPLYRGLVSYGEAAGQNDSEEQGRFPDITEAVTEGLLFLSQKQYPEGDYNSFGNRNPESGAQVILALTSLGIDCQNDKRFIKEGNTLLDGILQYRLPDGSFSHVLGEESNANATTQVFYALTALQNFEEEAMPFFLFQNTEQETRVIDLDVDSLLDEKIRNTSGSTGADGQAGMNGNTVVGYRVPVIIGIIVLTIVICIILILLKKRHPKNFIAVGVMAVIGIGFVLFTDFQTPEDFYQIEQKDNVIGTVNLSIRCDILPESERKSKNGLETGVILDVTEFDICEGETVYDILLEASKQYRVPLDVSGLSGLSTRAAYIRGIQYLYEYDYGDLSGWVYRVNGVSQSVGCGEYVVNDGDTIEWLYSLELGNDV